MNTLNKCDGLPPELAVVVHERGSRGRAMREAELLELAGFLERAEP